MLGENIGVTVDGESFVGTVYNAEGKHVMVVSDSYGNTCEYNLTVIRTLPDLFYAIGEGEAVKVDLERTYYFKDGISISITDALDEMAIEHIIERAKSGEIQTLYVGTLERLCEDPVRRQEIIKELTEYGVEIVTAFDEDTPQGNAPSTTVTALTIPIAWQKQERN